MDYLILFKMFRRKKSSMATIILIVANIFLLYKYYYKDSSDSIGTGLSEKAPEHVTNFKEKEQTSKQEHFFRRSELLQATPQTSTSNNIQKIKNEINLQCSSAYRMKRKAQSDINMADFYQYKIKVFNDSHDIGDWLNSWLNIQIDNTRFTAKEKLHVVLMPHAHVDPGWLFTFRQYYDKSVKNILDLMLTRLTKDPTLKFIWAEISLFDLWWNDISKQQKMALKKLLQNKQLEILAGGWVMPDEANTHYHSILIQQIEGNLWLKNHLNYYPKNGWSIDPFGLSPTMAYILVRSGFNNMVIQRAHYLVKKHFGNNKDLEFIWRQQWDEKGSTDIMVKMAPFKYYTTSSTCGPSEHVCKSFDYKYTGKPVTPANINRRTSELIEQYKKKSMLGKTNNILVPLGGDFAWDTNSEWDAMITNYNKITNYVNSHEKFQTEIRYGTLDDYFTTLRADFKAKHINITKITGDFFTYAHEAQHYWSGYFTSRPSHKSLERQLLTELRSSHLVYAFMIGELNARMPNAVQLPFINNLFLRLRTARRTLSLFQHHDSITGTSRDLVMDDFEKMMDSALVDCQYVLQQGFKILTNLENLPINKLENAADLRTQIFPLDFEPVFSRRGTLSLPTDDMDTLIVLNSFNPQAVVSVFNPLIVRRNILLTVNVQLSDDANEVQVTNLNGDLMDSELFPVFKKELIERNTFILNFVADLEPLSINSFTIKIKSEKNSSVKRPEVIFYTVKKTELPDHEKFTISRFDILSHGPNISNNHIKVLCDHYGFVNKVIMNGNEHPLKIQLLQYGTKMHAGSQSGLYLFHPGGKARPLSMNEEPFIKVVKGNLLSYIEVSHPIVTHRISLYNQGLDSYAIEIKNLVDLRSKVRQNLDLVMRFKSDIDSGNISYTDLNAFQMIQRKRFESMPIQGHFYPMPSATYIEDSSLRMTILGGHPVATASLESGQIEVGLDRTLQHDDNLGVGQGTGVAVPTISTFKLLLESSACQDKENVNKAPMLSLAAHLTLNNLLHPLQVLRGIPSEMDSKTGKDPLRQLSNYRAPVPLTVACDVELLDAIPLATFSDVWDDNSTIPQAEAAVLVHRVGFDSRFVRDIPLSFCNHKMEDLGRVNLNDIFGQMLQPKIKQMSLSFLYEIESVDSHVFVSMNPMEVYAFQVKFKSINIDEPIDNMRGALRL